MTLVMNTHKTNRLKGQLCVPMANGPHYSFHAKSLHFFFIFVWFALVFDFSFKYGFGFGRRLEEQRTDRRVQGDKWNRNACCEIHEESIKVKINE